MRKIGHILLWTGAIIIILIALALWILPPQVEKSRNKLYARAPYRPTQQALDLHKKLLIVDMHADALLWDRNLLKRSTYGHVDIPRLVEGNVALQAFTIVTKSPRNQNYARNEDTTDNITPLAVIQCWPMPTWWSLKQRALYQVRKLHRYAARLHGKFMLIQSSADLKNYLTRRKTDPSLCAGFLGIEGAQALEGDLKNIDLFYDAGIRMMSPTHFFDNDMAGSAHGVRKGGLTEKGKEMIHRMEAKHILIDLAHASAQTIADTLAIVKKPVVVSHTGLDGICPSPRNLTDEQVKAIAKTGGVICIGYWDEAVCGSDAKAIARSIKYAVAVAGLEHVGLGSDYDGSTTVPFDTSGLVELTAALLDQGFGESEIKMIMGGNIIRLLQQTLP
jgi:microsomal dipeptidase-like Zn-dependent dipeptidase